MDLELTDEQTWLSESIETLLTREWPAAEQADEAGDAERSRLWAALVEFGALTVDREDGLGAIELRLVARAAGAHLASIPLLGSAALRYAIEPPGQLPAAFTDAAATTSLVALLEPGAAGRWTAWARRSPAADCTARRSRWSTPALWTGSPWWHASTTRRAWSSSESTRPASRRGPSRASTRRSRCPRSRSRTPPPT